jgi:hypothetical protein
MDSLNMLMNIQGILNVCHILTSLVNSKFSTSIMFLDIIHRLVHFLKNTTFRRLDSVSVLR